MDTSSADLRPAQAPTSRDRKASAAAMSDAVKQIRARIGAARLGEGKSLSIEREQAKLARTLVSFFL